VDSELYKAFFDLSKSIADSGDLESLFGALAVSLGEVISFDALGLVLYDPDHNTLRWHFGTKTPTGFQGAVFSADSDSLAALVWREQKPRIVSDIETQAQEGDIVRIALEEGMRSLTLIPLSHDNCRLGVLGFGFSHTHQPSEQELTFLVSVASQLAVAVDGFLTKLALAQERDRMRVLFEITTALTSKLPMDELFDAVSEQLSRVVQHDVAAIALLHKTTGKLHLTNRCRSRSKELTIENQDKIFDPQGLPSGEAMATGKPVVTCELDVKRFPSPLYRKYAQLSSTPCCCVALTGREGVLGTLRLTRKGEPFTREEVDLLVQIARQISLALENSIAYRDLAKTKDRLVMEKLYLEEEIRFDRNFNGMIGESHVFQSVLKNIRVVAPTDSTVLVQGETGTGKELIGRAIHDLSERNKQPFVKVNCAAISATLLESELFGHEKGSFTGAFAQKIGRFELAHKGTLFLDEIGEIPLELQSKLLRALQEQELERVGGNRTIHVDVRFVAATNRNLKQMVDDGKFRDDLYYRLHVFPLVVPPLRQRKEDIPLLIRYFTQKYAKRLNRAIEEIPSAAIEALTSYDWPGNVRELQNIIERSVILSTGPTLQVTLPEQEPTTGEDADPIDDAAERERILRALRESAGRVAGSTGAAARLGMRRTTLQSRMKRLNIQRAYQ
jgi:formate hydrogenlyase transcriptional activator